MGRKVTVKRYKYKNIAFAMAIVLLVILGIIGSSGSEKSKVTATEALSESKAESGKTGKTDDSSQPFRADKLTKNYKYVSVRNSTALGTGKLVIVDGEHEYTGGMPDDLDGVYGYLFDNGLQIGATSSTSVLGREEMLEAFNDMLCDFYNETGLTTIMVSDMYLGVIEEEADEEDEEEDSSSADSEESEEESSSYTIEPTSAKSCYEHDTGLAVDLQLYYSSEGTYPAFDGTEQYSWFSANCWRYGFVLRYTEETYDDTGVEPLANHFRYVGKPYAEIMHNNSLSLEGFVEFIKNYKFENPYSFESTDGSCYALYYVMESSDKTTNCPIALTENDEEYEYEISGDNEGGYILCAKLVSGQGEAESQADELEEEADSQLSDEESYSDDTSTDDVQG